MKPNTPESVKAKLYAKKSPWHLLDLSSSTFKHNDCRHTQTFNVRQLLSRPHRKCLTCSPGSGPAKRTTDDVASTLPRGYSIIGQYHGHTTTVTVRHTCGIEWSVQGSRLNQHLRCPCKQRKVRTYNRSIVEYKLRSTEWTLVDFNSSSSIVIKHVCGNLLETNPRDFLYSRKQTCRACHGDSGLQLTPDEVATRLGSEFTYLEKRGTTHVALHRNCGSELVFTSDRLNRKHLCIVCWCRGWKRVKINKRSFIVQGVEDLALRYIVRNQLADVQDIVCHSGTKQGESTTPCIPYEHKGKSHWYKPDFYVPSQNRLVEVKDIQSLGLGKYETSGWFDRALPRNKAKAEACIAAGYKFTMLVFDRSTKRRIPLPKTWLTMSRKELQLALSLT